MSGEIDGDDRRGNDLVTVEFTRKQFSEFVLTHIQTPSEEFRTLEGGFDLDKETIKSIIDKIHYYVRVNNELLHWECSFTVYSDEETFQKISSYDDFFDIDRFDEKFFEAFGVTISFLVRFGGENLRAPEKQTIDLLFFSGKSSKLRVAARTTEFTWAAPVLEMVTREFNKIRNRVERDNSIFTHPVRSVVRWNQNPWSLSFYSMIAMAIFMIILFRSLSYFSPRPHLMPEAILNPASGTFEPIDMSELLSDANWLLKMQELIASQNLQLAIREPSPWDLIRDMAESIDAIDSVVAFFTFVAFFLGYREIKRALLAMTGRIWLSNSEMPKRKLIESTSSAIWSIVLSVCASAIFMLLLG